MKFWFEDTEGDAGQFAMKLTMDVDTKLRVMRVLKGGTRPDNTINAFLAYILIEGVLRLERVQRARRDPEGVILEAVQGAGDGGIGHRELMVRAHIPWPKFNRAVKEMVRKGVLGKWHGLYHVKQL
jgi:hypothetical protein